MTMCVRQVLNRHRFPLQCTILAVYGAKPASTVYERVMSAFVGILFSSQVLTS